MQRESFGSRLGFLLVSAGCAIGIGNVWRFPYITGKNGGGYFVLFYLVCLLLLGVPVMTMELAVGRGGRKSAVLAYKNLEKPGSKWHIHGWFCLAGCYLLMMYYTTVTGWMVNYFGKFLTGGFHAGMTGDEISGMFGTMLGSPGSMVIFTELVVVTGLIVCSFGLQKGLERVTKVMMICLLALIVVLAVHSLTLSGAAEGMKFYLLPSVDTIREHGLGSLITDAMNQAFFTLSLGIGAMEIFGSYMSDEQTLPGEAVRICILDTFVALMAGAIIFPACFTFGVAPGEGPAHLRHQPQEGRAHQRRAAGPPEPALRVWLQYLERLPPHSGQGRAGQRGLPRERPAAAHRLSGVSAVLRQQMGLELRQVCGGGQQGQGPEIRQVAEALFPVHSAGADRCDLPAGPAVKWNNITAIEGGGIFPCTGHFPISLHGEMTGNARNIRT